MALRRVDGTRVFPEYEMQNSCKLRCLLPKGFPANELQVKLVCISVFQKTRRESLPYVEDLRGKTGIARPYAERIRLVPLCRESSLQKRQRTMYILEGFVHEKN